MTDWWRDAVIYQIYPRSYADSDLSGAGVGVGVGDLPGITARLGHIAELGADAVWLSPFYRSPQADGGYDVEDHRDVDPLFGSLHDADALLAQAHSLGLRVLVDLVPNHTSSAHAWFVEALNSPPGSPQRDRFVFREGRGVGGDLPPNDWQSVFGGPAWQRVAEAPANMPSSTDHVGQWYLHLFDVSQPDLNWDSPVVRAEFLEILRFWLDRGVDGFRVDVAHGLIKQADLADWSAPQQAMSADGVGPRPPMWDQDGVHEIYREWRRLLDSYPGERILVAEAWVRPPERLAAYTRPDEMHQAFNFDFLLAPWTAVDYREVITRTLAACAAVGAPPTWVLSNHDMIRHASRLGYPVGAALPNGIGATDPQPDPELGLRRARAATLLMLALPGSAYLYQGEELGLPEHTTLPDAVREDPTFHRTGGAHRGRDGCRVPLPWAADLPGYGFSPTGGSWLPQPAGWRELALDRQRGVAGSTYELYRAALATRRRCGLGRVDLTWAADPADDVLRARVGAVTVLTNFGAEPVALPAGAVIVLASADVRPDGRVPGDVTVWATGHSPARSRRR